jgi:hypothetical protein
MSVSCVTSMHLWAIYTLCKLALWNAHKRDQLLLSYTCMYAINTKYINSLRLSKICFKVKIGFAYSFFEETRLLWYSNIFATSDNHVHPRACIRFRLKFKNGDPPVDEINFANEWHFTHSWSWALLEKLPIVQLLENFPAFYGTQRFITAFT